MERIIFTICINVCSQIFDMKNTIVSTAFIAFALIFAASCNKFEENSPSAEGLGGTVITAVADPIGSGTKVEMAYCYEARWQSGDRIHVKQGSTTDTFTLVGGQGTTKGTFEGTKSITGEIEAFYPVAVGETMTWPEIQANNQAAPLYAHQSITGEDGEIVSFSSLGAMLQIVFNSTVENITLKSIELKDGQKNLSGKFTVDENGQAVISATDGKGVILDLGSGKSLGKGANYFYLAIPAGTYNDLTISFYTNDRRVCTMHSGTFPEVKRNTVCRLTLTGTMFEERQLSGPGLFTVRDGRVVKFAKGNLYWDGDSFEFEDSQLDRPAEFDESHVGHFFWSNNAAVARARAYDSAGSGEHDVLFTNDTEATPNPDFTVSGVTGEFRTLSQLEWQDLIDNHAHKYVSVGDIPGVVLAPDGFKGSLADQYDADSWAAAEADGVVFLPSAGYRNKRGIVTDDFVNGKYWSSAPWTAYRAQGSTWYESTKYCSSADLQRDFGCCIRLVEDTKYAESVSLDKTDLTLYASQSVQLTATVLPADAPDKSVVWTSDNTAVAAVDKDGKVSAVSPGTAKITATTVDRGRTASCTITVEPLVAGEFMLKGHRVRFAKGNLYWNGSSFEFEDSQIDYPAVFDESHVGHFFWSMDAAVARAKAYNPLFKGEHDVLFTNDTETTPNPDFTVSGITGEFRSLSEPEWQDLLDKYAHGYVSIGEITGMAFAPASFKGSLANRYDAATWAEAEAAGVVFIPSAGSRFDNGIEIEEVNGKYWSSAPWTAYYAQGIIWYASTETCSAYEMMREFGCCIRLVKDIKSE